MEKKKRLEKIISLTEENEISAYKIGNGTNLNTANVQKILNREIENPRLSTIEKIEVFLDNYIFKKRPMALAEKNISYDLNLTVEEKIAEAVMVRMEPLFDDLKRFINNKVNYNEK